MQIVNNVRQSRLGDSGQSSHVFGPLDFEAILVVDGGEVFVQLEGSQCVRCYGHIDTGIETVNYECLGKHKDAWYAERELPSNLRVQRRKFLHSSENVKLSYSELQDIMDLEFHQVNNKPRQSASILKAIAAFRLHPHHIQHRVDEEVV